MPDGTEERDRSMPSLRFDPADRPDRANGARAGALFLRRAALVVGALVAFAFLAPVLLGTLTSPPAYNRYAPHLFLARPAGAAATYDRYSAWPELRYRWLPPDHASYGEAPMREDAWLLAGLVFAQSRNHATHARVWEVETSHRKAPLDWIEGFVRLEDLEPVPAGEVVAEAGAPGRSVALRVPDVAVDWTTVGLPSVRVMNTDEGPVFEVDAGAVYCIYRVREDGEIEWLATGSQRWLLGAGFAMQPNVASQNGRRMPDLLVWPYRYRWTGQQYEAAVPTVRQSARLAGKFLSGWPGWLTAAGLIFAWLVVLARRTPESTEARDEGSRWLRRIWAVGRAILIGVLVLMTGLVMLFWGWGLTGGD